MTLKILAGFLLMAMCSLAPAVSQSPCDNPLLRSPREMVDRQIAVFSDTFATYADSMYSHIISYCDSITKPPSHCLGCKHVWKYINDWNLIRFGVTGAYVNKNTSNIYVSPGVNFKCDHPGNEGPECEDAIECGWWFDIAWDKMWQSETCYDIHDSLLVYDSDISDWRMAQAAPRAYIVMWIADSVSTGDGFANPRLRFDWDENFWCDRDTVGGSPGERYPAEEYPSPPECPGWHKVRFISDWRYFRDPTNAAFESQADSAIAEIRAYLKSTQYSGNMPKPVFPLGKLYGSNWRYGVNWSWEQPVGPYAGPCWVAQGWSFVWFYNIPLMYEWTDVPTNCLWSIPLNWTTWQEYDRFVSWGSPGRNPPQEYTP